MKIYGDFSFIKAYTKPSRKKSGDGFEVEEQETPIIEKKSSSAEISRTAQVQTLLTLFQKETTPVEQKTIEYGENLLKQLGKIQTQLLFGSIENEDLSLMKESLDSFQETTISSPHLRDLINDIRVRLAVEIQKHSL